MHAEPSMAIASATMRPIADAVVIAAARIWRDATDQGAPVQPALHALLEPAGHDMLAPVFDSVMRLCEAHFDRRLCAECPLGASRDEDMLCRLIDDPALLDRIGPCGAMANGLFATALRSMQVMLAMERAGRVH